MARREVQPGQRYQPTDSSSVWEVRELTKDAEGIVHARLTRVGDQTTIKTLSVATLNNSRLYRLLPAESGEDSQTGGGGARSGQRPGRHGSATKEL